MCGWAAWVYYESESEEVVCVGGKRGGGGVLKTRIETRNRSLYLKEELCSLMKNYQVELKRIIIVLQN